jgi:hypothetical protein
MSQAENPDTTNLSSRALTVVSEAHPHGSIPDAGASGPRHPRSNPIRNVSHGFAAAASDTLLSVSSPKGRSLSRRSVMNALFGTAVSVVGTVPAAMADGSAGETIGANDKDPVCTHAELASCEFEGMPAFADDWLPNMNNHLSRFWPSARIAAYVLGRSKAELVEMVKGMDAQTRSDMSVLNDQRNDDVKNLLENGEVLAIVHEDDEIDNEDSVSLSTFKMLVDGRETSAMFADLLSAAETRFASALAAVYPKET